MMRVFSLLCLFLAFLSYGRSSTAQQVTVTIDSIVQENLISGHTTGFDGTTARAYRVIVYVHTDIWYIHPYAGQGEGASWAAIGPTGSWSIKTVKRQFAADRIAALVVTDSFRPPSQAAMIRDIPNVAVIEKVLSGTQDFGKL
jgi:hypothetical protein